MDLQKKSLVIVLSSVLIGSLFDVIFYFDTKQNNLMFCQRSRYLLFKLHLTQCLFFCLLIDCFSCFSHDSYHSEEEFCFMFNFVYTKIAYFRIKFDKQNVYEEWNFLQLDCNYLIIRFVLSSSIISLAG